MSNNRLLVPPSRPSFDASSDVTRTIERGKPFALGTRPGERDDFVFIPEKLIEPRPPIIVFCHGAGNLGSRSMIHLQDHAERYGVILVCPTSNAATWDLVRGFSDLDAIHIQEVLDALYVLHPFDTERMALAGFSDGATYALSLGVGNGDLFKHIIAFSPGFIRPAGKIGDPDIFVSHGTKDRVLNIDYCGRAVVEALRITNYTVTYKEFNGAHTVPPAVSRVAVQRFVQAGKDLAVSSDRPATMRSTSACTLS